MLKMAKHASWACNANLITLAKKAYGSKKGRRVKAKASVIMAPNVEKKKNPLGY